MYRYMALAAIVLGGMAPAALAQDAPPQPSAMERLIRQEDARWNDPRLGLAEEPAWQPSAIERLQRQEDARANDPRLGIVPVAGATSAPPAVQIVAADGFDWVSAGLGALVGLAVALVGAGFAIVSRASRAART